MSDETKGTPEPESGAAVRSTDGLGKVLMVTGLECFQETNGETWMWVITTKEPALAAQGHSIAAAFANFGKTLQGHVYLLERDALPKTQ